MQLGTRWRVGATPPAALSAPVRAAVGTVEEELTAAGQDTAGWGWTLTYLEGNPIVDLDDGTRIREVPGEGAALITSVELDAAED